MKLLLILVTFPLSGGLLQNATIGLNKSHGPPALQGLPLQDTPAGQHQQQGQDLAEQPQGQGQELAEQAHGPGQAELAGQLLGYFSKVRLPKSVEDTAFFEISNNDTERQDAPEFQLRHRKTLGLFYLGERLRLNSQTNLIPLVLSLTMPTFQEMVTITQKFSTLQTLLKNSKNEEILRDAAIDQNTIKAIKDNVDKCTSIIDQIHAGLKAIEKYLKAGRSVPELPADFNRYCITAVKFKFLEQATAVSDQIYAFKKPPTTLTGVSEGDKIDYSYDMLAGTQTSREMLFELGNKIKFWISEIEALTHNHISPELTLKLQQNQCLENYVPETIKVQTCVVLDNTYNCHLEAVQNTNLDSFAHELIGLSYPDFITIRNSS